MKIKCDWLRFTFDVHYTLDDVVQWLGTSRDDFIETNGLYGYKHSLANTYYGYHILYDGNDNMGVCVDVPSKAIMPLCQERGNKDVYGLLCDMENYCRLSRIDLAGDDFDGYFTVEQIQHEITHNNYSTRAKEISFINKYTNDNDRVSYKGLTVYVGQRTSETMLRIYDKDLEQHEQHKFGWVRYELEFKGKKADLVRQDIIISGINAVYVTAMKKHFRLITRDDVRNTRCTTSPRYEQMLLLTAVQCQLTKREYEKNITLDQKYNWLMSTCSKAFALVNDAGIDTDLYGSMLQLGREKFTLKDYKDVCQW